MKNMDNVNFDHNYFVGHGTSMDLSFETAAELNAWFDSQDCEAKYFCRLYSRKDSRWSILGSAYMWLSEEERFHDEEATEAKEEAEEEKPAKTEEKPVKVRKISGHDDWFDIWQKCGENMIETMIRNLKADLEAGYNSMCDCIRRQREAIAEYQNNHAAQLRKIALMDDNAANRWCYADLKVRGWIV